MCPVRADLERASGMPEVVSGLASAAKWKTKSTRLVDRRTARRRRAARTEGVVANVLDVRERAADEVVDADDAMPALEQVVAEMRAEEPGAAGDERGRHAAMLAELLQVLVRLHVEPHGEQRELGARDQEQRDEDDRRRRDRVARDPQHDLGDAEAEARRASSRSRGGRRRRAGGSRGSRTSRASARRSPSASSQEIRGTTLRMRMPGALADVVDRPRRDVAHARVDRRSGGRAGRSGSRSACRCGRGRAARASRARSPCSPPASRRRASSRRRSSSAARGPRCRGSGARDQLPGPAGDEPVRLRVVDLAARRPARRASRARPGPSGCRRPSRRSTSSRSASARL